MQRSRRSEIVRRTRLYLARMVEETPTHALGLHDGLETDEERALADATAARLAEEIRSRTGNARQGGS